MKVLNLYAGIGGNRKLWADVEVTAIENNPDIAKIYQDFFPDDKVIVADAHQYLLEHYKEFDFIWSSPPCPTHSRFNLPIKEKRYPDMKLYEEIIFLHWFCKGNWVVENVVGYYEPLIRPSIYDGHYFWSNRFIKPNSTIMNKNKMTIQEMAKESGYDLEFLRRNLGREVASLTIMNCVLPKSGRIIFDSMNNQELKLEL